ncbi:MAG: hypothetical protein ACLP51_07695 [Syntrophobacteraceae bacterium]
MWRATRNLVNGAAETAERQLRAYISVTPKDIFKWRDKTEKLNITATIENHGQTVGFEITDDFSMAILDDPLPGDFIFPNPDSHTGRSSSLFPRATMELHLFFDRVLTDNEIIEIETGSKSFHIWGILHYQDAFHKMRTTEFRFSFGGPDFAKAAKKISGAQWSWVYGQNHNKAT